MRRVKNRVKPAGEQVVLAHRLLKNSISSNEYILATEDFIDLAGEIDGKNFESRSEICEGIGKVNTWVYYPDPASAMPVREASVLGKINLRAKLMADTVQRSIGLRGANVFKSLTDL